MVSSRESFFLWGYLKSKVYVRKPRTVDDLKVSIREEIATVPQEILINVMQNFEERLRKCVRQEGRHLSDIIFRNWVINVSNQNCIYYRLFWYNIIFYIENKKVTIIWNKCVLFAPLCITQKKKPSVFLGIFFPFLSYPDVHNGSTSMRDITIPLFIIICFLLSWVKRDQLDATCFIITLFSAQHVSRTLVYEHTTLTWCDK